MKANHVTMLSKSEDSGFFSLLVFLFILALNLFLKRKPAKKKTQPQPPAASKPVQKKTQVEKKMPVESGPVAAKSAEAPAEEKISMKASYQTSRLSKKLRNPKSALETIILGEILQKR